MPESARSAHSSPEIPTSPRLGLLSGIRLAGNGSFRFLYPFLPVVAAELAVPDAWAGVLVGALAVGGMASPIVRGWLVGAMERPRRLLVLAGLIVALGALGVAAAPVAVVAVVALVVMGAGKPLLDTAAISYVSARTTFATRARATSTMELTWAGSLIVIAPAAGLVASVTSWRVAMAMIAVATLVLAAVARARLDVDDPHPGVHHSPGDGDPPTLAVEVHPAGIPAPQDEAEDRDGLGAGHGPHDRVPHDRVPHDRVPHDRGAADRGAREEGADDWGDDDADRARGHRRHGGLGQRAPRGLRATFASLNPTARDYLLVVAFAFGALEATFSVFGLWLDRVHGVPLAQLGGFAAVVATGELVGAGLVTVAADRIGKARTLMIGLAVCAAGLVALAATSTLTFGVGALAVGLVGSETAIVAAIAIASEVQPDARSRYLAVMFAITSFTRAVVGGIGPAVFATVGIGGNVAMSVLAAGVAAVMLRRAVTRNPGLAR